jgi:uncharacterized membrane protein YGL010W
MRMGNRSWDEWVVQYSTSHTNTVNRACHTVGIPMIAVSLLLIPVAVFRSSWWAIVSALFVLGWAFQFVGHAFERKAPEFFKDWRFLFVGLRWWIAKMANKV